jgi:hypothetical protein
MSIPTGISPIWWLVAWAPSADRYLTTLNRSGNSKYLDISVY